MAKTIDYNTMEGRHLLTELTVLGELDGSMLGDGCSSKTTRTAWEGRTLDTCSLLLIFCY